MKKKCIHNQSKKIRKSGVNKLSSSLISLELSLDVKSINISSTYHTHKIKTKFLKNQDN